MRRRKKTAGYANANPPYTTGLHRKALAPRSTLQRHESASNHPEWILKLPSAAPDLGDTHFLFDWPRGSDNEAKRHVAGIGVVVCDRRDPLGHRRHILASGHRRDDDSASNRGGGATTRRRGERETGRAGGSRCDAR